MGFLNVQFRFYNKSTLLVCKILFIGIGWKTFLVSYEEFSLYGTISTDNILKIFFSEIILLLLSSLHTFRSDWSYHSYSVKCTSCVKSAEVMVNVTVNVNTIWKTRQIWVYLKLIKNWDEVLCIWPACIN